MSTRSDHTTEPADAAAGPSNCCDSTPSTVQHPAEPTSAPCCGTTADAHAEDACCGSAARADAVAANQGCCR